MNYRKIWETYNGSIPDGYEIHHIDGDRQNNDISNLICLSLKEHYEVHYNQGDWLACAIMSERMKLSQEERKSIHKKAMESRDQSGERNPMYGRSAILENNMKWYNNGKIDKMFPENEQEDGFVKGRLNMPDYDRSGSKNPKAKAVYVNDKLYNCLKQVSEDYPNIPYPSLKTAARLGYSKKYNLRVKYA